MTSSDDWRKTVRLNKLLGMWAAEKLGITGPDAEAYSDALAVGTLENAGSTRTQACGNIDDENGRCLEVDAKAVERREGQVD